MLSVYSQISLQHSRIRLDIDGLVQDCSTCISIANRLEIQ